MDEYLKKVQMLFDFSPVGREKTQLAHELNIPDKFKIGLIVGSSGSGKTQTLLSLKDYKQLDVTWDLESSLIEQIHPDPDTAISKLLSAGFSSVPQWFHKYNELSEGQKFRAYIARCLDQSYIAIDEFTSKLDRLTARTVAYNLYKYIHGSSMTNIILSSPFRDIIPYLHPDWVYDVSNRTLTQNLYKKHNWSFKFIESPDEITTDIDSGLLYIMKSNRSRWNLYKSYHYLSSEILNNCEYWEVYCKCENNNMSVGYIAVSPLPLKDFKAKREHRLVILPEAQGMGIGIALSEFLGQHYVNLGYRYYCKTSHPNLGKYRNSHPEVWKPTTYNNKVVRCNQLSNRFTKKRELEKRRSSVTSEDGDSISRTPSDNTDDDELISPRSSSSTEITDRKLYYCHEYRTCENTAPKDVGLFKRYEIDPSVSWKPTTLVGVLKEGYNKVTVRFQRKRENFLYEEYGNNPETARSAAMYYLEQKNIETQSPTLYYISGEIVYILVSESLLISTSPSEFEKIKDQKLFYRNDTKNKRIFYILIEDGKRKRKYLDEIIEFKIIDEEFKLN